MDYQHGGLQQWREQAERALAEAEAEVARAAKGQAKYATCQAFPDAFTVVFADHRGREMDEPVVISQVLTRSRHDLLAATRHDSGPEDQAEWEKRQQERLPLDEIAEMITRAYDIDPDLFRDASRPEDRFQAYAERRYEFDVR